MNDMPVFENIEFVKGSGNVIQTYTGGFFDYDGPERSQINIQDIAHSLAQKCRFNGHTKLFYSVAEHSHLCYIYLKELKDENDKKLKISPKTLMYALLHDAAEMVISDIPAPFKDTIPEIGQKEDRYLEVILDLLELDLEDADKNLVKQADRYMLLREARELLNPATNFRYVWGPYINKHNDIYQEIRTGYGDTNDDVFLSCWDPEEAEAHFLEAFNDLRWERP